MRSVKYTETAKIGYIVISILFCITGGLMIVVPGLVAPVISRVLGIFLILFGSIKLVGYYSRDLFRLTFQFDLALGILTIILGMIIFVRANHVMTFLSVVYGVYVMADSMLKIQIAFDSRAFGIRTWWLIFAVACITGAIGFIMVFRPFEGAELLVTILGMSLLAEGILNLITVITTVKVLRHQLPDERISML